jgi:hypothetical protein
MTLTLDLVLVVLAFMCFAAATFGLPARVNLIATGLALWILSVIL